MSPTGQPFCLALAATLALTACTKTIEKEVVKYKYKIAVVEGNLNDPRCGCNQSHPISAVNTDPENRRTSRIAVVVRDANTGVIVSDSERSDIIGTQQEIFLGCSIADTTTTPQCNRANEFELVDETILATRDLSDPLLSALGPIYSLDIQACVQLCTSGSAACLSLGKPGSAFSAPFVALLDASGESAGTIPKTDLFDAYNLPSSADKCERGDIEVTDKDISNSGSTCEIRLSDYTEAQAPVDMKLGLPTDLAATKSNPNSLASTQSTPRYIRFDDGRLAPAIGYEGAASQELIDRYGGAVRAVAQVGDSVILATSNGCLSTPAGK